MNGNSPDRAQSARPKSSQGKKFGRWLCASIVAVCTVFVAMQIVPVDRSNPTIEVDLGAPKQVDLILRRACYDCHSNETVWPWYSRIAPVSWVVANDVKKGRAVLNFSTWTRLGNEQRAEAVAESWEEVAERKMPTWYYVTLHPDARLSEDDKSALREWARSAGGAAGAEEHGE